MTGSVELRIPRGWAWWLCSLLAALLLLWGPTAAVEAHASLVKAEPGANSEWTEAPGQIVLTFNERLEEGAYYLRVYDGDQRLVTEASPAMNETRTTLTLPLPQLPKGAYLVTYHVISADGHPVEGAYLFAVGQTLGASSAAMPEMEHMHRHGDPIRGVTAKEVLQFASRIAFYITMLVFTGWLFWYRRFGMSAPEETRQRLRRFGERWQQAYLIVYILFLWLHLSELIGEGGGSALVQLFTGTVTGYAWLAGLLLALSSFFLLYRNVLVDFLWVAAVWSAKGLLGHAAAFEPLQETLLLNWLHLGASAVWAGGLVMLLLLWRTEREQAKRMLPGFSTGALISILVLTISGVLSSFIFLPDITYVLETAWGRLLLVKTGLVLLVVCTAGAVRYAFRRMRDRSTGRLIAVDGVLMALILGIVGVFTYLSPLPVNEPLNWHVMGEKIHMTAKVEPMVPGVNDFIVKVWLPEPIGDPKAVVLKIKSEDQPEIPALSVPLEPFEDKTYDESYGMKRTSFKATGAYLPYPGHWQLEVRVMNSQDDETVYHQSIRVY